MIVAELIFKILRHLQENVSDEISHLLHAMRKNGQLLGIEFPIAHASDRYLAYVMMPASDSLNKKYWNVYVKQQIDELQKLGLSKPIVNPIGPDDESCDPCRCRSRTAFILFTTYVSLESPLRCFECFLPVPLYQIPPTSSEEYSDVLSWVTNYKACDSLQMNCAVGEQFATRQLSAIDSSLTKQGRVVCDAITTGTKRPTYYYLYRSGGRSLENERRRTCPGCSAAWLRSERLHGLFDFQCDHCGVLSNIAWNVRTGRA